MTPVLNLTVVSVHKANCDRAYEIFREELKKTVISSMLEREVSAEALAKAIGLPPSTVRNLRLGNVGGNFFNVVTIFTALGVSVDEFIYRVGALCCKEDIKWPTL